jgi:putative NAD(P)-binding protein
VIEASNLEYTVIRAAWLTDKNAVDYELTKKGEPFKGTEVSRKSVAAFITELIEHPDKEVNANVGIDTQYGKEQAGVLLICETTPGHSIKDSAKRLPGIEPFILPNLLGWGSAGPGRTGTILMVSLSSPFQTIPLNKHLVLLRISPLPMMLLLVGNIASDAPDIRVRN